MIWVALIFLWFVFPYALGKVLAKDDAAAAFEAFNSSLRHLGRQIADALYLERMVEALSRLLARLGWK